MSFVVSVFPVPAGPAGAPPRNIPIACESWYPNERPDQPRLQGFDFRVEGIRRISVRVLAADRDVASVGQRRDYEPFLTAEILVVVHKVHVADAVVPEVDCLSTTDTGARYWQLDCDAASKNTNSQRFCLARRKDHRAVTDTKYHNRRAVTEQT
eukprot:3931710-Rhodomonas_salina.3